MRLDVAGIVAGQVALAIDHARLASEMRSLIHESETLLSVGTTAAASLELSESVRRITREAARAIGADSAGIYVVREEERRLEPLAAYHLPKPFLADLSRLPLTRDDFVQMADRSRWTDDVPNDPDFQHPLLKKFPMQSLLLVSLRARNRRIGFLVCAWWTARRTIKPEELRLMEVIGDQAALAIEAARLAASAEHAAVGRERTRMDGLLHDTLSSTLFALALKLDGCLHRAESEEFRTMLEGVKQHAKTMMTQIRGLVAPQTA
jgi:GAF domain-containing protein